MVSILVWRKFGILLIYNFQISFNTFPQAYPLHPQVNAGYIQNQGAHQPNGQLFVNFNVNNNISISEVPSQFEVDLNRHNDDLSDEYDDDDVIDEEFFDVIDDMWELPSQGLS